MSDDIGHILRSWAYNPKEDINVRLIEGDEGKPKIQMRVEMGIVQIELDGNPAGEHIEGYESWLEYYEDMQKRYEAGKVDDYYSLSPDDFKKLRIEGIQFYYRYLSLMKLGDYERVIRDTNRNLRLFHFVKKYAATEIERWSLDQYRPYVIMVNTQAMVSLALRESPKSSIEKCIEFCDSGIGRIITFYKEYGISSEIENSLELSILKSMREEFLRERPETLEERLQKAVGEERFEDAASIRDEMNGKRKKK